MMVQDKAPEPPRQRSADDWRRRRIHERCRAICAARGLPVPEALEK